MNKKRVLVIALSSIMLLNFNATGMNITAANKSASKTKAAVKVTNKKCTLKLSIGTKNGIYTGYVKNNIPNGKGTFSSHDSAGVEWTLSGNWTNGHINGKCTYISDNGDKYIGEYKNDKKCGKGTYVWFNGDMYTGNYKNDLIEGSGTYTYSYGLKCVGQFKNGKLEGHGTYTMDNGTIKYTGELKDGKSNGQGTYVECGSTYTGKFKNGLKDGQGTMIGADGHKYVGGWKNDKMEGLGTYIGSNGDKYTGEFKNNEEDGQGTLLWASDGSKYIGQWKNGNIVGQGTLIDADGSSYTGQWKDNRFIVQTTTSNETTSQQVTNQGATDQQAANQETTNPGTVNQEGAETQQGTVPVPSGTNTTVTKSNAALADYYELLAKQYDTKAELQQQSVEGAYDRLQTALNLNSTVLSAQMAYNGECALLKTYQDLAQKYHALALTYR